MSTAPQVSPIIRAAPRSLRHVPSNGTCVSPRQHRRLGFVFITRFFPPKSITRSSYVRDSIRFAHLLRWRSLLPKSSMAHKLSLLFFLTANDAEHCFKALEDDLSLPVFLDQQQEIELGLFEDVQASLRMVCFIFGLREALQALLHPNHWFQLLGTSLRDSKLWICTFCKNSVLFLIFSVSRLSRLWIQMHGDGRDARFNQSDSAVQN